MARYTGGLIRSTEFTSNRFGITSGMFTLGQQLGFNATGTWPSDYDVVLQFPGSGTWECPTGVTEISEYLIVAGGGGAGGYNNPTSGFYGGGGGGAGGIVSGTGISVVPGKTYDIQTGAGGVGRGGGDANSSNGINSAIKTEANVLYYVAVGAADPGPGNRYYVKTIDEFSGATANVEAETLKLYEGSTYRFDQSHPTNSGHPFRFSSTVVSPLSSATAYDTGVTTNQPSATGHSEGTTGSTAAGTPGSIVQLQVATPAPQLYYYCTQHPVSGTASMGGAADTLANITTIGIGGGRCAPNQGDDGGSGGGSGLFAPGSGSAGNALQPSSASGGFGNAGGSNAPSATNAQGGGGGGAGEPGENGYSTGTGSTTRGGNGGNGIHNTISGSNVAYGGGGGGGGGDTGGFGGFGGGGDGGSGNQAAPSTPYVKVGGNGTVNTGGGGGGAMTNGTNTNELGGIGGSGVVFLKYKNKLSNKVFKFNGSTLWKNDFNAKTIDYLVVAGGGAGGADTPLSGGGGGGAGGLRAGSGLDVSVLNELTIQVGGGGVGGTGGPGNAGTSGTGSFIQNTLNNFHLGSNGGGSGGRLHASEYVGGRGAAGGSGGGGGSNSAAPGGYPGGDTITFTAANGHAISFSPLSFTQSNSVAQGTNGGIGSHVPASYVMQGGGGGAGGAGGDNRGAVGAGHGGTGLTSTIEGQSLLYAGGGAGGASPSPHGSAANWAGIGSRDPVYNYRIVGGNGGVLGSTPAESASEFTGGGGGGQGHFSSGTIRSGDGGSGIVVIKITG